jgi:hypothetical protein
MAPQNFGDPTMTQLTRAAINVHERLSTKSNRPLNLTPEGIARGREIGALTIQKRFREAYESVAPIVLELRQAGYSQERIGKILTDAGHVTREGFPFGQSLIRRILRHFG